MSPEELRDPVYLRAWCIDQTTMVVGRENISAEHVLGIAHKLETAMQDVIQRFPVAPSKP